MARKQWRCFHCDEVMTTVKAGLEHFGHNELCEPICTVPAAEVRRMECELDRYRADDSDKDREFYAFQAHHYQALMREEEKGYERGLRDGKGEVVWESQENLKTLSRALVGDSGQSALVVADKMRVALEWYANSEIYQPHPHGSAFDKRDLSYVARAALSPSSPPTE